MESLKIEWIGAVAGAIVSLMAFIKWVWPFIRQGYRNIMDHSQLQSRLEEVADQLGYVVAEMKVNGGSTIRDALIRIEDSVALTNERQRARMLDSKDLVFETDSEGNCVWVNRTYARIVQRTPQELMGHGWANAVAESHRDRVVSDWYRSVSEDREFSMQIKLETPDGDTFGVEVKSYRMVDSRGNVLGYLGSMTLV